MLILGYAKTADEPLQAEHSLPSFLQRRGFDCWIFDVMRLQEFAQEIIVQKIIILLLLSVFPLPKVPTSPSRTEKLVVP